MIYPEYSYQGLAWIIELKLILNIFIIYSIL